MSRFAFAVLTLVILACAASGKFPADIQPCKYNDEKCLSDVVTSVLRKYAKDGNRELGIIPFDPLRLKSVVLEKSNDRPVTVEFRFKDIDLFGLSQAVVQKVTGFKKEASDFEVQLNVLFPKVTLKGPYKIKGRVLVLPVVGEGNCEIVLENISAVAKPVLKRVEKNGKAYVTITKDSILDLKPKKVTFKLDNLFNGDKTLGESMNKLMNENWDVVYTELKPLIDETFAKLAIHITNGVFELHPYEELFLQS